jgi:hypothetical protein
VSLVYRVETATEQGDATVGHTQSRCTKKSEYSLDSALPASGCQP